MIVEWLRGVQDIVQGLPKNNGDMLESIVWGCVERPHEPRMLIYDGRLRISHVVHADGLRRSVHKLQMFLADDGHHLIADRPSRFSSRFDWIVTEHTTLKQRLVPSTVFVKTDYLPRFVETEFKALTDPFVLITGSSDWSPSVNFPFEYDTLVNSNLVIKWYMLNCLCEHPKVIAYPGGLCHNEVSDDLLMKVRIKSTKSDHTRILCCWRDRDFNVCGDQYKTRSIVEQFVKNHPELFDWVDPSLSTEEFYSMMARYKYVLCPLGNGVDPCPKAWEAIVLKTIPIMLRTQNTQDVYASLPALCVDSFGELLHMKNLDQLYITIQSKWSEEDVLYRLSCDYWYYQIMHDVWCNTHAETG